MSVKDISHRNDYLLLAVTLLILLISAVQLRSYRAFNAEEIENRLVKSLAVATPEKSGESMVIVSKQIFNPLESYGARPNIPNLGAQIIISPEDPYKNVKEKIRSFVLYGFIGKENRSAILQNGGNVYYAKEGDTIDGVYKVREFSDSGVMLGIVGDVSFQFMVELTR